MSFVVMPMAIIDPITACSEISKETRNRFEASQQNGLAKVGRQVRDNFLMRTRKRAKQPLPY